MDNGFHFGIDLPSTLDAELDFDLDDFDIGVDGIFAAPQEDLRILPPRLDVKTISHRVLFENAEQFADQIDLTPGARTFAWVNGGFIFGDIVEALILRRDVGVKRLYITSLSFSQENVDSLKNVMLLMGDDFEKLVLVFSGYHYSHEKFNLVPYMYQELDEPYNRVQIAFGAWHTKVITLETCNGNTITIHGSANLRSSNSVEQIMVEINDFELHRFNADMMQRIADRFGTINHDAPYSKLKRIEGKQAWEAMKGV